MSAGILGLAREQMRRDRPAVGIGDTGSQEQVPKASIHKLLAPTSWKLSFHSSQLSSAWSELGPANIAGYTLPMVQVTKKHRVQPGMRISRMASWMKCHLAETYRVSQVKMKG